MSFGNPLEMAGTILGMSSEAPILQSPPGSGLLWACPHCGRWFVLRKLRVENDAKLGDVDVYRCRSCERETKFIRHLPPHVV